MRLLVKIPHWMQWKPHQCPYIAMWGFRWDWTAQKAMGPIKP